jgi:vacuolar protein sorting-associated protein 72
MSDTVSPAASPPRASDANESSSDDDDSEPTVALGREKRANAGSRMAKLIELAGAEDELAEEEGYGEIFAEAANDEDFTEERHEDGDVDMSSSSEDEGEAQDEDAGEKELVNEERAGGKKRKRETLLQQTMRLRRMKYPAELRGPELVRRAKERRERRERDKREIQQEKEDNAAHPRKLKKSERVSWALPPEVEPVRASSRKHAIENKQQTIRRMKENQKRREKTLAAMQAAEERKKARGGHKVLTQADRLAEAAEVERVNRNSVNAWEESEKRRAEEQQARLAALKNRSIPGPVMTFWSGREICRDGKLILLRKQPLVTVVDEELREHTKESPNEAGNTADGEPESQQNSQAGAELSIREKPLETTGDQPAPNTTGVAIVDYQSTTASLLDGIEYWANLPADTNLDQDAASPKPVDEAPTQPKPDQANEINEPNGESTAHEPGDEPMPDVKHENDDSTSLQDVQDEHEDAVLEEADMSTLAARSLIILREFPRLPPANPHMRDRHAKAREATTRAYHRVDREGAPVIRALFTVAPPPADADDDAAYELAPAPTADDPDAVPAAEYRGPYVPYDPLRPASSAPRHSTRYATKRATACALTGAHARYRDGATGLPFATARAYASVRRLMGGRARVSWSATFQCWIDDRRPASGVPRAIWDPAREAKRRRRKGKAGEDGAAAGAKEESAATEGAGEAKSDAESKKSKAKALPSRRATRSSKEPPAPKPTRAGTKRLRSTAEDSNPGPAAKTAKTAAAERSRRSTAGKK